MNSGQTVFSQLMDRLPFYEFQKCVERYRGDAHHSVLLLLRPISGYGLGQLTYRQSLRDIEACLGSMLARPQIWIAVSSYAMVAIVRKRIGLEASLYEILQILSLTQFERTPILQALQPSKPGADLPDPQNQLILFDL
jgi:hypothetical protein